MLKITKIVENGEKNVGVRQMLNENVGLDINCWECRRNYWKY